MRKVPIASLTVPADIRVLYWLVNNIKPQAIIRGQKICCVGGFHKKITANNIEYRPPLTTMRGSLKSKFKWRRSDIGTKAAMATALMVKNVLRAPRKRDEFAGLCMNKRFTHTYLQAVSLRPLVSCQMIISRRLKSGFYAKQIPSFTISSALHERVAPFDFVSCDRAIYCAEKTHTDASRNTRAAEKTPRLYLQPWCDTEFERSHMTSASVAVNGLLFDHFGIEKCSSPRITFARTKNRIFPFPQYSIDHSLKYVVRLRWVRSWGFEVSKINFVFTGPEVPSRRFNIWLARVHRGHVIEPMSEKSIHT